MTFDVYPGSLFVPTFGQVLELGTAKLHSYLKRHGGATPAVSLEFLTLETDKRLPVEMSAPFIWSEDQYLWFTVEGFLGGTDGYCCSYEADNVLFNLPEALHLSTKREALLATAQACGRWWYFRRSTGQPAIIVALFGFLASALAELTDGVLYSDDGAWEMPYAAALPDDFDKEYLCPERATTSANIEWAARIEGDLHRNFKLL